MTKRKKRQADSGRKKSPDDRGRLVRAFRKSYDVTLEEMAKRVGLSQPMLTRFETGTRNLSAGAWASLLVAMSEIEKEKGAERKARFDELQKEWFKNIFPGHLVTLPGVDPPRLFMREVEAEQKRIIEDDESGLELSKLMIDQAGELAPRLEKTLLAEFCKNPAKYWPHYLALNEWRQKILNLEAQGLLRVGSIEQQIFQLDAQGYAVITNDMEQERKQLKARVTELEQELKAWQELQSSSTRRIEELEQELARERTNKAGG